MATCQIFTSGPAHSQIQTLLPYSKQNIVTGPYLTHADLKMLCISIALTGF